MEGDHSIDNNDEEAIKTIKKSFILGCFGLPWLLILNVLHYKDKMSEDNTSEAFKKCNETDHTFI